MAFIAEHHLETKYQIDWDSGHDDRVSKGPDDLDARSILRGCKVQKLKIVVWSSFERYFDSFSWKTIFSDLFGLRC